MNAPAPEVTQDLDPTPRLLMGPGPVDVYPRVLRAMSAPMLGQFDPEFTEYMNQTMALYRQVYQTHPQCSLFQRPRKKICQPQDYWY